MIAAKHSLETEQEVLETLMHFANHKNVRVQKAMLKLDVDCFFIQDNREIYRMIRKCFDTQESFHFVDILSLVPRDDDKLHGSVAWLADNYRNCHAGEAKFENYVERLITLMQLRKQIQLTAQMLNSVQDCPNPAEAKEILVRSLEDIAAISYQESKHGISNIELSESFYDGLLKVEPAIPTTCERLNQELGGGIMPKSLITIAAGAGVGKTGISIFLMDAIARMQTDTQSLFFSLEMEAKQIWFRHVGICAGKQFDKLTKEERLNAVAKSMEIPIQIYDTSMCKSTTDIDFILTTARLRAIDKKISVIVVDYLGLVDCKGSFESNALKQTEITSKLARLAIDLDCTVIALSQINRSSSARSTDDRCPYPSDASGSSGSYFSSTLWLGVDRPELYLDDPCYNNQFVIKCRKNRFGSNFELILAFNEGTFAEVSPFYFKKPEKHIKSSEEAIFSARGRDFYAD